MPFCRIALRDKTWPINAKNTITKDNSTVLAIKAVNSAAEEGEKRPRADTTWPYFGCIKATMKNKAEQRVEYNDVIRRLIEYPLRRGSSRPWVYKSGSMLLELSNRIKHFTQTHLVAGLTFGVCGKAPHTPSIRWTKKGVLRCLFSEARHGVGLMIVAETMNDPLCTRRRV
jgi:hypothetical protein